MFRKSLLTLVFTAGVLLSASIAANAQNGPVNGIVQLDKADGTHVPVAGALIEVYRVDIKVGFPSTTTNKKGEFAFIGIPLGVEYAFSISAPNCEPKIFPNVKAGQEGLVIKLKPGDGKKLTEDEVRSALASAPTSDGGGTADLTDEQKKLQAEYDKKNAEILAKNKRMQEGDAIARKANEEGAAALKAGNYDLAIAKYSEGVTAVPDFIGSTPIMLSGRMEAQKLKGFNLYKEGMATADLAARKAKYSEANGFYDQALESFQSALDVVNNAEAPTDPAEQKRREGMKTALYAAAMEIHRLKAVGDVDNTKAAEANTVITEYLALTTDPAKQLNAYMTLGEIMRRDGDLEKAVAAYRKVLELKPENAEAMGKLGLCLFSLGAGSIPEDKDLEQEGLNYMQRYTELAPIAATDSPAEKEFKTSIKESVDYLKSQKMAPQKPASTKKKN